MTISFEEYERREYKRAYMRDYRRGIRRTKGPRSVLLRVLDKLDREPGELVIVELGHCWVWRGATNSDGYGVIRGEGRRAGLVLVHRVTLAAALGRAIAPELLACHRCHNRRCARPAHLYEGTYSDNMNDMYERRRPKPGLEVAS